MICLVCVNLDPIPCTGRPMIEVRRIWDVSSRNFPQDDSSRRGWGDGGEESQVNTPQLLKGEWRQVQLGVLTSDMIYYTVAKSMFESVADIGIINSSLRCSRTCE
jgi:hypothetical protein